MPTWRNGLVREMKPVRGGQTWQIELYDTGTNQRHRGWWANPAVTGMQAHLRRVATSGGPGAPGVRVKYYTVFDKNQNRHKLYLKKP